MMTIREAIAKNMEKLRIAAGLTQTAVARYLDVKVGRYQHWEAGRATPPIEILAALCKLYCLETINDLTSERKIDKKEAQDKLTVAYRKLSVKDRLVVDLIMGL